MQAAFCAVYCSSSIVCTLRFVSQHKFIKIGLNNIKMLRKHNYGRSELYLKCIRILSFCFLGPSLLFKGSRAELSCVCHAMCAMPCSNALVYLASLIAVRGTASFLFSFLCMRRLYWTASLWKFVKQENGGGGVGGGGGGGGDSWHEKN